MSIQLALPIGTEVTLTPTHRYGYTQKGRETHIHSRLSTRVCRQTSQPKAQKHGDTSLDKNKKTKVKYESVYDDPTRWPSATQREREERREFGRFVAAPSTQAEKKSIKSEGRQNEQLNSSLLPLLLTLLLVSPPASSPVGIVLTCFNLTPFPPPPSISLPLTTSAQRPFTSPSSHLHEERRQRGLLVETVHCLRQQWRCRQHRQLIALRGGRLLINRVRHN